MKKIILSSLLMTFLLVSNFAFAEKELSPAEIMEKYGNAVVLIATVKNNEEIGLGSGFIVKDDGVIITNYHVIEGAYPALIKLKNEDVYEDISVIDYNERKDVIVIKIKGFDLPIVTLGNSNDVKVGEGVVVIGNPHGLENTIADGLLSQIRDTDLGYKLHQISAPISPGSSGSPVFNNYGEVIGIATLSDVEGQNLNFSVPINYARGMIVNPIKYSLKEFAGMEKDESALRDLKTTETIDNKNFLEYINSAIIHLTSSWDLSYEGFAETSKPHEYKFKMKKFRISTNIYSANKMLKNTYKDLDSINTPDSDLREFKNKLMNIIKEALRSSDDLITALEYKSPDAYGVNWPDPQWTKAQAALEGIAMSFRKMNKDFVIKFIDRVRKDHPELENKVLPFIIFTDRNRNKSEEEVQTERKKIGRIGVQYKLSSRLPIIATIEDRSPAKKVGLKKDDIILGLVDGKSFLTQMDYWEFQDTTKPGDKYKFRIERNGKVLKKTIRMF